MSMRIEFEGNPYRRDENGELARMRAVFVGFDFQESRRISSESLVLADNLASSIEAGLWPDERKEADS